MNKNRYLLAFILAMMGFLGGEHEAYAGRWSGCFGRSAGCYGVAAGCYGPISAACYGNSASCYGGCSGCYGTSNGYGWSSGCGGVSASCYAGCYGVRRGPLQRLVAGVRTRLSSSSCYCVSNCYGVSGCYGVGSCYGSMTSCGGCYAATLSNCFATCKGCFGTTNANCYTVASGSCFTDIGCYGGGQYSSYGVSSNDSPSYEVPTYGVPSYGPPSYGVPSFDSPSYGVPNSETTPNNISPTVIPSPGPAPSPPTITPANDSAVNLREDTALLSVSVPAETEIIINGKLTRTAGLLRQYKSSGLIAGKSYTFEVQATIHRDGERQSETKIISLSTGTQSHLTFAFPDDSQSVAGTDAAGNDPPFTQLTLHVPDQATVSLAGKATKLTGSQRVFQTARLVEGHIWSDYRVRVTLQREGREIVKEKSIDLRCGEVRHLHFDFDDSQLASH